MTEPVTDMRIHASAEHHDGRRARGRYLPSAQVLEELAALGPDLGRIAADLRDCLSGPGDDERT